jgi:hypothetical protein
MVDRIIRNSARCLRCGDEIVSWHRHDFVRCSCGTIGVDGGRDYLRRVGNLADEDGWVDTSIVVKHGEQE